MNPMETMAISVLSKLTGMTPEQMRELAEGGLNMIKTAEARLSKIEADVNTILDFVQKSLKDDEVQPDLIQGKDDAAE